MQAAPILWFFANLKDKVIFDSNYTQARVKKQTMVIPCDLIEF